MFGMQYDFIESTWNVKECTTKKCNSDGILTHFASSGMGILSICTAFLQKCANFGKFQIPVPLKCSSNMQNSLFGLVLVDSCLV